MHDNASSPAPADSSPAALIPGFLSANFILMQDCIIVQALGQDINIPYSPKLTVLDVKLEVQKEVGVAPNLQLISFNSDVLKDGNVLADVGVSSGDILCMSECYDPAANTLRVFVSSGTGVHTLNFCYGSTVDEVIENVRKLYGARSEQWLSVDYNGQELEPGRLLSDYGVQDKSLFRVLTQLEGGR